MRILHAWSACRTWQAPGDQTCAAGDQATHMMRRHVAGEGRFLQPGRPHADGHGATACCVLRRGGFFLSNTSCVYCSLFFKSRCPCLHQWAADAVWGQARLGWPFKCTAAACSQCLNGRDDDKAELDALQVSSLPRAVWFDAGAGSWRGAAAGVCRRHVWQRTFAQQCRVSKRSSIALVSTPTAQSLPKQAEIMLPWVVGPVAAWSSARWLV